jgi:hypothetical protein
MTGCCPWAAPDYLYLGGKIANGCSNCRSKACAPTRLVVRTHLLQKATSQANYMMHTAGTSVTLARMQVRQIACSNGCIKGSPVLSSCQCDHKNCNSTPLPPKAASRKHCKYHQLHYTTITCRILTTYTRATLQIFRQTDTASPVVAGAVTKCTRPCHWHSTTFQVCRSTAGSSAAPARCGHTASALT